MIRDGFPFVVWLGRLEFRKNGKWFKFGSTANFYGGDMTDAPHSDPNFDSDPNFQIERQIKSVL
jgi:hypothetical protein